MPEPIILPFHTNNATLALVGGKGANLAKLSQAGFPVPGGLITTEAYRNYVQANHLESLIQNRLTNLQPEDPTSLRSTSNQIQAWFTQGTIPPELVVIFKEAYASLGECPVAVRSSATAEIAAVTGKLLNALQTNAAPKNRSEEAAKAPARAAQRFSRE